MSNSRDTVRQPSIREWLIGGLAGRAYVPARPGVESQLPEDQLGIERREEVRAGADRDEGDQDEADRSVDELEYPEDE